MKSHVRVDTADTTQDTYPLADSALSFFYASLPYILIGQWVSAMLLAVLMYGSVPYYYIIVWLVLHGLIGVYRLVQYRLFRRASEEEKQIYGPTWLDRFYADVLLSGLAWGAMAFLIFPFVGAVQQMIVLLYVTTVGFGSMAVIASKRNVLLIYTALVFFPVIVRLFLWGGPAHQTLAFSELVLVLIMLLTAYYYGDIIRTTLATAHHYKTMNPVDERLNESFFSLLERAPVGVFRFDQHLVIKEINAPFRKLSGAEKSSDIVGHPLKDIWPDAIVLEKHQRVLTGVSDLYQGALDATVFGRDTLHVRLATSPVYDDDQEIVGGITIIEDIASEVQAKKELARLKHYDTLTGIPNRTLLLQHIGMAVDVKLHTGIFGGLLFLDIDHFNNINRTYGQKTGDIILKKIAKKLEELVGTKGTVARIGADTFAILFPVLDEERSVSREKVLAFITELRMAFEKVLVVGEADYHISFTIGVAMFDTNVETPLDILRHAESTMIDAKNAARGTVRFYEAERDGVALMDMAIANDIYKAIRNNEFTMYYQPQQDIHTGILTGAESLVRWNHPRRGAISPALFIPIAEESGAIIRLEEWIFEQVFKDMRVMASALVEFPLNYIAVNVSSSHFLQPNFVEKFVQLVHKHRINPQWVNIEITESGIMSSIDEAINRIRELKRLGFGFSIDDFGTGYSSLTYLKKLPVDIIKIDRSFVKDADRDEEDRLIVESVIEISRRFGFKVLAEGIDRQETLDYFRSTSCKTFQGYLFYKPISMEEFIQLI